mmetsp:Transcript_48002/g.112160  ORF Transcript_48002/g.112160 Transcript_48002/m.112160 type:complete len:159 (+) Transcript_48002:303-779(+)
MHGIPGLGGLRGGVGQCRRFHAHTEANPEYQPQQIEADEEGNVTLSAWASFLPEMKFGGPGQPSAWPTEVLLPRNSQIQVLEAWYGHPSDPSRRLDVTQRVREFLAERRLGAGLANLVRDDCYSGNHVKLPATSAFWGQDPAPFVWKKLTVRYRPPER